METIATVTPAASETRNYGVDLLRITAMLMITVMHMFVLGGVIFGSADIGVNFYLSWMIQALCEVATDCFFLISGYFLVTRPAHYTRAVNLWCTMLFYSWAIFFIFLSRGLVDDAHSPLLYSLLPVTTNNYWFMTCYIALVFLSPYMNLSIRAMRKQQLQGLIIVLLIVGSLWSTLFPMVATFEHHGGMTVTWSLVVYFVGAYLRLHVQRLPKKLTCLAVYVGLSAAALLLRFLFVRYGNRGLPVLLDYANVILTYTSPLTFAAAIALFLFFLQLDVRHAWARRCIRFLAPTVLAAYLITMQHNMTHYLWTEWLPIREFAANWWFLPYVFGVAVAILFACCLIDHVRARLFTAVTRAVRKK